MVVLMVLRGSLTVNWCVLVMFVVLRGFFTVNWCVLAVLMALTGSFTKFCCVEARCAGSLPGPPRVMLTHWWWWQAVGKVINVGRCDFE